MSTEDLIAKLEREWAHAVETCDQSACDPLLAEAYTQITGVEGQQFRIDSREECAKALTAGTRVSVGDVCVAVHGAVAIATVLCTLLTTKSGSEQSVERLFTDVWVQDATGWRVVERHASRPVPKGES